MGMPNTGNNDAAMLAEMRNMLLAMGENARKLDVFIAEFSSALPDLRTEVALLSQAQISDRKHLEEHCLLFHKGENSLLQQVIVMRQEMKELMLRSASYIAQSEKMINLENRIKVNETSIGEVTATLKESPKTNREKALHVAQWIAIGIMGATWLWDKFHK